MDFDHRQLSAFLAIATHGSLGRAAEVLHVTQPALSRIVKRLEDQVGAPLFERNSKGMLLTAVGQTLVPHASLMARVAGQASEELLALRGLAKGTIKVGGIASAVSMILPQALQRVLQRWPKLQAQITEGVWDRLADALANYEIDIMLAEAPVESDALMQIADCSWRDYTYIVASSDHPLQRKQGLTLEDTLQCHWACTPRGTAPYRHMQRTFHAHGLPCPELAAETRSILAMKSLMKHAGFLCWMNGPMFESERAAGLFVPLPLPDLGTGRTLAAFRRRDGMLPAPAVKLLDELRVVARAHQDSGGS